MLNSVRSELKKYETSPESSAIWAFIWVCNGLTSSRARSLMFVGHKDPLNKINSEAERKAGSPGRLDPVVVAMGQA
jgi:hypothetical protein